MKKFICLLLALVFLFLTGCSDDTAEEVVEETPTPTVAPTQTPEPTAAPTPVPVVEIADYQYYVVNNTPLAISFKYPSHWINNPGKSTICYTEPVDSGDTAARLAVTSRIVTKTPENKEIKAELNDFLSLIEEQYPNYELGETKDDVTIMETRGYRAKYTANDPETGDPITGYVLICYVKGSRRYYLLHFTAPSNEYDELSAVVDVIRESLTTT